MSNAAMKSVMRAQSFEPIDAIGRAFSREWEAQFWPVRAGGCVVAGSGVPTSGGVCLVTASRREFTRMRPRPTSTALRGAKAVDASWVVRPIGVRESDEARRQRAVVEWCPWRTDGSDSSFQQAANKSVNVHAYRMARTRRLWRLQPKEPVSSRRIHDHGFGRAIVGRCRENVAPVCRPDTVGVLLQREGCPGRRP